MPKRTDIKKILIIGSGPIIIGQACEFDYSGSQACKALMAEGFEVVLINSNPATIMTDPEIATVTYVEPIIPEIVERIIQKERPDALLPTLGGQTGLNVAIKVADMGVLEKYNVKMIGANYQAIKKAENREQFKAAMQNIGLDLPKSAIAHSMKEARKALKEIGLPVIIRPSFTMGGTGGGIAYTEEEFEKTASGGLQSSMIGEILIEESIIGWKEYELEVMRDTNDNVVIICSIENFDPMGIHTGDSITVAPAQTLTDREYQKMRDASLAIIREIGVETGGSNIQFGVNPADGRMVVIEMNPRVSRSSALASKATGFPIAKIAAKLAVGYTLDEIQNDITKETPASFEPSIDYCVVKIPRFTFEKFPDAKDILGISMKSVGETMAIGRTFKEALQKGLRSLEIGHIGLDNKKDAAGIPDDIIKNKLKIPNASRIFYIKYALQKGWAVEDIHKITGIDPWFIYNIYQIVENEKIFIEEIKTTSSLSIESLREAKEYGFSDRQIALWMDMEETEVRSLRKKNGIEATFKLVDTCAAEFEAYTPYFYSTYEQEDETRRTDKKKIMILGGGPNRIGQGIEFDYCCCHAAFALREMGFETIMVNSNPETVSTDYDTSDKLYFEPLTFEDVMNIVDKEKPDGIIVQFGGQTPLNLARRLRDAGAPIIGTSVESIDLAEDREKFSKVVDKLMINQTPNSSAYSREQAFDIADRIGYPVVVRPSYVLGGRAMRIVYDDNSLEEFIEAAVDVSDKHPILIDKFLEDAIEVDVDAIADGEDVIIAGIMEHIEAAGVHSGDSACVLPPYTLGPYIIDRIKRDTFALAKELNVVGLMNIQFAVKDGVVYVLEVNPRASRTVPFVSKAKGVPYAKIAAKVMAGMKLRDLNVMSEKPINHISVKEAVFPFTRFPGVDAILGPEMKSTGEVMGIDTTLGMAFYKSQIAAGMKLPTSGTVLITVADKDKEVAADVAKDFKRMDFDIIGTRGTNNFLKKKGISSTEIKKIKDGENTIISAIKNKKIDLIINTPIGKGSKIDDSYIRKMAMQYEIPYVTTVAAARAAAEGIRAYKEKRGLAVKSLQEYHKLK
jgi:carbamoyl-phosphate synthase large subunit